MHLDPVIVDITSTTTETLFWPPGMPFTKRVTRFYEIELITGGAGTMTTSGKRYCTMRGNIFFRKPGVITQGVAGYYGYGIAFDPIRKAELDKIYRTTIPYWISDENTQIDDYGFFKLYPDCYQTGRYTQLEPLFAKISKLFSENRMENQDVMGQVLQEIFCIIDEECRQENVPQVNSSLVRHYDLILSCKQYIDNNLEKHFTLEELANHCGLSKNFFSKTFKGITGMTPFEYIIESRMLLARKLILTTNISIDQIVMLCGFDDRTYFYRMFKKRFQSAPAVLRKNYMEQINVK